jgi:hypothetical protein
VDRRQLLGRQDEVARDDQRTDRDHHARHRFGAGPAQRLVEEGAQRQCDGGQRDVADVALHHREIAGQREPQAREHQQVQAHEGEPAVGAAPVTVQPGERPRQREDCHRAPREEAEAQLADQRLERLRGRARARHAAQQPAVLAGHHMRHRDHQQHDRTQAQQRQGQERARLELHRARAQHAVSRDVAAHARRAERPGPVDDLGHARVGLQAVPDDQRGDDGQHGQDETEQRAARVDPQRHADDADGQIASALLAVGRPGETSQAAQGEGQGGDERSVGRQLARLEHEQRHRSQRHRRQQRGARS